MATDGGRMLSSSDCSYEKNGMLNLAAVIDMALCVTATDAYATQQPVGEVHMRSC